MLIIQHIESAWRVWDYCTQALIASHTLILLPIAIPHVVEESAERRLPERKVRCSKLGRVKPMSYKIDTCRYLAWHLALILFVCCCFMS